MSHVKAGVEEQVCLKVTREVTTLQGYPNVHSGIQTTQGYITRFYLKTIHISLSFYHTDEYKVNTVFLTDSLKYYHSSHPYLYLW